MAEDDDTPLIWASWSDFGLEQNKETGAIRYIYTLGVQTYGGGEIRVRGCYDITLEQARECRDDLDKWIKSKEN